jgi:hypothetical protein
LFVFSAAHTSFNPPEPPQDHWGLGEPLPVYETRFELRRQGGTIAVLDPGTGEVLPELRRFYVSRDKFLADYEKLVKNF